MRLLLIYWCQHIPQELTLNCVLISTYCGVINVLKNILITHDLPFESAEGDSHGLSSLQALQTHTHIYNTHSISTVSLSNEDWTSVSERALSTCSACWRHQRASPHSTLSTTECAKISKETKCKKKKNRESFNSTGLKSPVPPFLFYLLFILEVTCL